MAIRAYAHDDEHADDLLQDCWVQILGALDSYGKRGPFSSWAVAVSRNFCQSKVEVEERLSGTEVSFGHMGEIPEDRVTVPSPGEQSTRRYWAEVVNEALGRLPDRERDVVVLRLLEGWDTSRTAAAVGVSESGVRSILRRAMSRLRKMKRLREALPKWMGAD